MWINRSTIVSDERFMISDSESAKQHRERGRKTTTPTGSTSKNLPPSQHCHDKAQIIAIAVVPISMHCVQQVAGVFSSATESEVSREEDTRRLLRSSSLPFVASFLQVS